MGVDIYALRGIKLVIKENEERESDYEREDLESLYDSGFNTIEQPGLYSYEEQIAIWHSSYGWYNVVRERLANLAGLDINHVWNDPKPDTPFVELLNFSDCEGTLDTKHCKALLEDFNAFQDKAITCGDDELLRFYNSMHTAFKFAAENGAVKFC